MLKVPRARRQTRLRHPGEVLKRLGKVLDCRIYIHLRNRFAKTVVIIPHGASSCQRYTPRMITTRLNANMGFKEVSTIITNCSKSFFAMLLASVGQIRYTIVCFRPHGDIAQLVERLNGIEKVRGSTPLISTTCKNAFPPIESRERRIFAFREIKHPKTVRGNAALCAKPCTRSLP